MKTNIHFFITSRLFILRIKNFSDKICTKNETPFYVE